ncbi:5-methyltetrahydropteroyltriglutamate--homocysteine S-methyltransferase [Blattabacterium cuenoti]|uniref:5-methyltetrahydropteroyltriglutamate-- homocysteine S-methyltransferase n=1 Tax=Blattabacterium cuenoti TaxID=1653831 RepID=UPI00163CCB4E|nr:5-methyltetrahydropteroyltriglutamate--homocysteine S-methyltransferase [Blattabacterium cuenoti]
MWKHNLGFPRIGINRELKKASELYWSNNIDCNQLFEIGRKIRFQNWNFQINSGLDLITCNDFSFYDHVLDLSFLMGVIPKIYLDPKFNNFIDLYFSMARGYQDNEWDIKAMEMTKWFNTNYHYIVPEFTKDQKFFINSNKIFSEIDELNNILNSSDKIKPVLIGPVTYLYLGKEKDESFHKMDLIDKITFFYIDLIKKLVKTGIKWIQLDEPILSLDLSDLEKKSFKYSYEKIYDVFSNLDIKILLTTYFGGLLDNISILKNIIDRIHAIHIDLIEDPNQLDEILSLIKKSETILSLGIVDGRNIWKNRYSNSIRNIKKVINSIGMDRLMISPNCSLLHVPIDLDKEKSIHIDIKNKMSFAKQKIDELSDLEKIIKGERSILLKNSYLVDKLDQSNIIHNKKVKNEYSDFQEKDIKRKSSFSIRQKKQQKRFNLPLFPTTTIGSFPQTKELRSLRNKFKKKELSKNRYEKEIKKLISYVIKKQEDLNLDVLVHGEFERNDMVEFFSDKLNGILSTKHGWVQSYGSRCVKPPIIYGDVSRTDDMTTNWICYAQSKTNKFVKGMLTGPVTILKWSFVRDDQPIFKTAYQIAWAIRDEVLSLERSGIKIIQIDEPALREGLPLKKKNWNYYFNWSINAFRIASSGVKDDTQIHTHMCYSEFNDIIEEISELDADVITIENSRSNMDLLKIFSNFSYPNEIGPGVYDIHSPRIPTKEEIFKLIQESSNLLPIRNIWINPDCGLKTRKWKEVFKSIKNMTEAAKLARIKLSD